MTNEDNRSRQKKWYDSNRERKLEYNRLWRKANRERCSGYHKKWRLANPERHRAIVNKSAAKHRDQINTRNREWYSKQPKGFRSEYNRLWNFKNYGARSGYNRQWRKSHPDRVRMYILKGIAKDKDMPMDAFGRMTSLDGFTRHGTPIHELIASEAATPLELLILKEEQQIERQLN